MKIILYLVILVHIYNLYSSDRNFTYVYQSSVLGKGNKELEIWSTSRVGRDIPFYSRFDHRIEFEAGITDKLQSAFYFNFRNISEDDGSGMKTGFDFKGISTEWKFQFSRPGRDPLGFALYSEIGLNTDEAEIEARLILDKKIKRHTLALNFMYENEWELSSNKPGTETSFEADFGWCYKVSGSFTAGIEARNHNDIVNGDWKHSALFAGPVFSYTQPEWWAVLTIMPQITALKGKTPGSNLVLDNHEKLETRLIFSFRL